MQCLLAPNPCSIPLSPAFWRSGLRPSLVQGLRPRNAPLQNHPSPPPHSVPDTVLHPPHFPSIAPAEPHTPANYSPSQKSPKSQFRPSPFPPPPPAHAQITAHHKNPPNHSSDKIPNPPTNPRTRANHSPSQKSPKSQFRPSPFPPTNPRTRANHSPSQKSPKSQFRQNPQSPHQPPHTRKSQPITKIPQITVQTIPIPPRQPPHTRKSQPITKISQITVQTKSPMPPPTPARKSQPITKIPQITVQTIPIPPRQPPYMRKSQPITKIPQITVQTKSPTPPTNARPPASHSPSRKSPKSQCRQNPPFPPPTPARVQITVHHENPTNHSSDKNPPNHSSDRTFHSPYQPHTRANHSPSRKSPKSQFRQSPKSQFRQKPMNSTGCESEGEGGPLQVCNMPVICLPTANNQRRGISRENKRKGQKWKRPVALRRSTSYYVKVSHGRS